MRKTAITGTATNIFDGKNVGSGIGNYNPRHTEHPWMKHFVSYFTVSQRNTMTQSYQNKSWCYCNEGKQNSCIPIKCISQWNASIRLREFRIVQNTFKDH